MSAAPQRATFLAREGDAYHRRNRAGEADLEARAAGDPLLGALRERGVAPAAVLEVGAGSGWRLAHLRERHPRARCAGIDPSALALREGRRRFPQLGHARATAERLPFPDARFDLVILGFCLYLVDRDHLFRAASEVDRVLAEGGWVAILDFHAERPRRQHYAHAPGCFSYKMDYARMFLWDPAYRLRDQRVLPYPGGDGAGGDRIGVSLLERRRETAWPDARADGAQGGAR